MAPGGLCGQYSVFYFFISWKVTLYVYSCCFCCDFIGLIDLEYFWLDWLLLTLERYRVNSSYLFTDLNVFVS